MSALYQLNIKKESLFLLGWKAGDDRRSEKLLKLCEDAGNKTAAVLRGKQCERSEENHRKSCSTVVDTERHKDLEKLRDLTEGHWRALPGLLGLKPLISYRKIKFPTLRWEGVIGSTGVKGNQQNSNKFVVNLSGHLLMTWNFVRNQSCSTDCSINSGLQCGIDDHYSWHRARLPDQSLDFIHPPKIHLERTESKQQTLKLAADEKPRGTE